MFAEALAAFAELLGPAEGPAYEQAVRAEAEDRPALLAAWLEELAFLAESQGFVPASLTSISLAPAVVEATVTGASGAPAPLVKAVTYHRLLFEPQADGYHARVVLDV